MTVNRPYFRTISTIVLGDLREWRALKRHMPVVDGIGFHDSQDMLDGLVDVHNIQMILSPLITQGMDALEIAGCLQDKNFGGMYRVVAKNLVNPQVIIDEVHRRAPDVNFDILTI